MTELELADNLGGGGPNITSFGRQLVGKDFTNPTWLWGTASQRLTSAYDPKSYEDIYFLLDAKGHVVYINNSPASTLDGLLAHVNALGN